MQINSERGRIPNSIQTFRPLYFWRFLLSVISILLSHYYIFTHNSYSIYYPDPVIHTLFCDCRFFSDGFLLVVYILEDFGSMHRRTIKIRKSPCVFFLTYTCIICKETDKRCIYFCISLNVWLKWYNVTLLRFYCQVLFLWNKIWYLTHFFSVILFSIYCKPSIMILFLFTINGMKKKK